MVIRAPDVILIPTNSDRKLYFNNNLVEDLLVRYSWTGCTNVKLRDEVMSHAGELIRQIIMTHGLNRIYPGQEESAFGDLYQTAWVQIERTLYKYKARPHCFPCYNINRPQDSMLYDPPVIEYGILRPEEVAQRAFECPSCSQIPPQITYRGTSKVFNLWSQVARTVVLAYIKKESRDYKNQEAYKDHLDRRSDPTTGMFTRFIDEASNICRHSNNHLKILDALKYIMATDERPYEGIIGKLVRHSGQSRAQVSNWLKIMRLRSHEFTDSPINERPKLRLTQFIEPE